MIADTRRGPIEYEDAGAGVPLLVIHGAGGGHDQGMAFARPLLQHGVRVIAPSRFGYLGTPLPADASPAAQADAHICLLDALGIERAAVVGISAGGPSSLQTAIRHPERVSALMLVAPLTYTPRVAARYGAPPSAADRFLDWMVGSDFVYWTMMHAARELTIARVLGTPPALVARADAADRARVQTMLEDILPISARAAGLRNESLQATHLRPDALDRIVAPTLIISARDDGYGTFANAEYTAPRIAGARFIRFDQGGHMLVGHDGETMRALLAHLRAHASVAPARRAG
jgi:pimeloyl-ACP methyl ester carboxylesterase